MDGPNDLSLYIHWPYCSRICPYCDFNVTRDRGQRPLQTALIEAICEDMRSQARGLSPRRLRSVYFGGGTPSLMAPLWVSRFIELAKSLWPPLGPIEITLEANPTDMEMQRLDDFAKAGINRLSLGVQSLNDQSLLFLGRNHDALAAMKGIEVARRVFDRVSLDLIYALPHQTIDDWIKELREAVGLGVEHISPYQLSFEPDTAFGRAKRRGRIIPIGDDAGADFFDATQLALAELGFEAYEVSNHALSLKARSEHNVAIWLGGDYVGVGPGAHGRLSYPKGETNEPERHSEKPAHGRLSYPKGVTVEDTVQTAPRKRVATEALRDIRAYIGRVQDQGIGHESEALTPLEAQEEAVMLGLRFIDGVAISRLSLIDWRTKAVDMIEQGFLKIEHDRLKATLKGRLVLDRLIYQLLS